MKRTLRWGAVIESDVQYGTDKPTKMRTVARPSISAHKPVAEAYAQAHNGTVARVLHVR